MSATAAKPAFLRLAGFLQLLRDHGFRIGLAEGADAGRLFASPTAMSAPMLRAALRALLCSTLGDWQRFDALFDGYFLGRGRRGAVRVASNAPGRRHAGRTLADHMIAQGGAETDRVTRTSAVDDPEIREGRGRRLSASTAEALARKDMRHVSDAEEMAAAQALAERLARRMRARLTRRDRIAARGRRLDFRRTIHASIGRGGEPVDLHWRKRKPKPLRLVLLLDVSGSMELYAPFFVRFMHGVLGAFREAEAFVFHTRLVHIAPALRDRDAARAVERMSLMTQGLGGGTRIGESLAAFNRWHARRVIHSRTCVMILSDGFETGSAEQLGVAMGDLRKRCRRIVWLNPLIGWESYEPSARGMQAAMAHIDLFAPAHNLESLAALEPYLARI